MLWQGSRSLLQTPNRLMGAPGLAQCCKVFGGLDCPALSAIQKLHGMRRNLLRERRRLLPVPEFIFVGRLSRAAVRSTAVWRDLKSAALCAERLWRAAPRNGS